MKTREQAESSGQRTLNYLAADLSMWVARETLLNLVLSVVQAVEDNRLRSAEITSGGPTLPPRLMLALLTYCYATGLHASSAIADKICEDPALQYFCVGRRPAVGEIRRFRNHHRELVAHCLEIVCLVVWRIRFGAWRSGEPAHGRRLLGSSHRFDPLIQIEIKCEVMERLYRAEVEDSCGLVGAHAAA